MDLALDCIARKEAVTPGGLQRIPSDLRAQIERRKGAGSASRPIYKSLAAHLLSHAPQKGSTWPHMTASRIT
jgi:hypothetical protein